MAEQQDYPQVKVGEGYAVGHLDDMGQGPGFRKVRQALGVREFGVNAVVVPPGIETGAHYHDRQEELYFVHKGALEIEFDDGSVHLLREGSFARVDARTVRRLRNRGEQEAVYLCVGAQGGYVGRDGRVPPGEEERVRQLHG